MSRSFAGLYFTRRNHIKSRFSQLYLSSNYSSPGILLFAKPRGSFLEERTARNDEPTRLPAACCMKVVKGIFVTRPLFLPVKCEMANFFLVNHDFHSGREA